MGIFCREKGRKVNSSSAWARRVDDCRREGTVALSQMQPGSLLSPSEALHGPCARGQDSEDPPVCGLIKAPLKFSDRNHSLPCKGRLEHSGPGAGRNVVQKVQGWEQGGAGPWLPLSDLQYLTCCVTLGDSLPFLGSVLKDRMERYTDFSLRHLSQRVSALAACPWVLGAVCHTYVRASPRLSHTEPQGGLGCGVCFLLSWVKTLSVSNCLLVQKGN